MFTTGETVGLSEWIIDDICLVSILFTIVKAAKGLNIKGKNGTNDAFVTIAMGKEKYQTSVKEKATENVEWREQCEL